MSNKCNKCDEINGCMCKVWTDWFQVLIKFLGTFYSAFISYCAAKKLLVGRWDEKCHMSHVNAFYR